MYWINAAQDWFAEIARLAESIGLHSDKENENHRLTALTNAFGRFLHETPDTLVVFYNVEDPHQLTMPAGNLISSEMARLLFTTRRRDPDLPFQSTDVRVLLEEIALKLLLSSKARLPLLEQL